ncbi:MAG: hypothetical protein HZA82_02425 [Thaumarchaeota archaeon]|nr:hypothetical protein [Nitrososphaerota archaeon]
MPQPVEKITEESHKYKEIEQEALEETLTLLEKKLKNIEKTGKRTTYAILLISLLVGGTLSFYIYEILFQPSAALTPGKFLIENLSGQQVNTWVAWYVTKESPLYVSIVNSNLLSKEKINVIKNAILSEETVELPNSVFGKIPSDEKHVYYVGWKGALKKINDNDTSLYVPKDFEIEESDKPIGKILIILSKSTRESGTLAITRSIADESNHQILKSFVTIYDIENLNDDELAAVTRYEFGHALGLPESTKDGVYQKIDPTASYISECVVKHIISLYNERDPSQVICN